ncbi:hypothetical protein [Rhodopila globiformis]|uniref:DUF4148 domain-containing protein n=1 Tax=Rhodopila globiformis TaxID=1071 RepID=A0A2S6MXS9_RHOGL|nr:hypothetical protein [Rhodopila globiformis]PPQ27173.1 hypothetical protein CCS01_27970 [Rhodopila globiformis]
MQTGCIRLLVIALLAGSAVPAWARGPWRASGANTSGWALMTPEERIAHQARVRSFTDYDACEAYRSQHHALMAERAQQQGVSLNHGARDFCAHLRPTGKD